MAHLYEREDILSEPIVYLLSAMGPRRRTRLTTATRLADNDRIWLRGWQHTAAVAWCEGARQGPDCPVLSGGKENGYAGYWSAGNVVAGTREAVSCLGSGGNAPPADGDSDCLGARRPALCFGRSGSGCRLRPGRSHRWSGLVPGGCRDRHGEWDRRAGRECDPPRSPSQPPAGSFGRPVSGPEAAAGQRFLKRTGT